MTSHSISDKFCFREWPFSPVPTDARAKGLWADRTKTAEQIEAMLTSWVVSRSSTINLLWADLGAGKTHTLLHLQHRCTQSDMLPIYVLLPQTITRFNALYRAISDQIDWERVSRQPLSARGVLGKSLTRVLTWITSEIDFKRTSLAQRWILGEKLTQAQCDSIGATSSLVTPDDCVEILRSAITALSASGHRVILMIDEYQRVAEGTRRQLQEIGHAIHTLYNACPQDFTLLLSCAMGNAQDYGLVLTPEILSRLSAQRIELPYLTTTDIKTYTKDLFNHYRLADTSVDPYFPLSDATCGLLAEFLRDNLHDEVTPRKLNEAMSDLLLWSARTGVPLPVSEPAFTRWLEASGAEAVQRLRG